jgi:hypothetical protein
MKTILVGYDEPSRQSRVLARAAELAAAFEAKVTVTSVAQVLVGAAAAHGIGSMTRSIHPSCIARSSATRPRSSRSGAFRPSTPSRSVTRPR